MKKAWSILAMLFLVGNLWAEPDAQAPKPDAPPSKPPILEIFEAKIKGENLTQMGFDPQHPLLTVRGVQDVRLAQDGKGVLLVLNPADAKTLAAITGEFNGRPLFFKTVGGTVRPITINGAVDDGRLGFKYPEAGPIADDFRRYFRLGEFEWKGLFGG